MSLNAPYSLAHEPDGAIQISKSGTNPFWTELQAPTHDGGNDTGQQQNLMDAAAEMNVGQNRREESRESDSSSSYVPPDTVLAKMSHNSQRNLESANVNGSDPEASCSAGPGYPTPADSSNAWSNQEYNVRSFSAMNPTVPLVVPSDHSKKERPHSLQVTSSTSSKTAASDQGQNPVKGILKKPSGSVSFDTTVQISSEGGIASGEMLISTTAESTGFNESDYSGMYTQISQVN